MCLIRSGMDQQMFAFDAPRAQDRAPQPMSERALDLPGVLERLATVSERPRYTFMVLNLIAKAGGTSGSAGPYVGLGGDRMPVRDWLCDALAPMAQRDSRRIALARVVREELVRAGGLPADEAAAERVIEQAVRDRVRRSGRTHVSRAVSELVRAGLLRRHYQGYRIDHHNRGAQREAVYTLLPETRAALASG